MTGKALVLGIGDEPPVAAATQALARMNLPFALVDQRYLVHARVCTWWDGGSSGGVIDAQGGKILLDEVSGVYTRLTSWSDIPEVAKHPQLLGRVRETHHALESWLEVTEARVVNRTSANDTNNSKPYQSLLIRDHFDIPATLVTNEIDRVESFRQEFGHIIYKSISGERSIVTSFTDLDVQRLPLIANAPVQFQEHISGVQVRVHVVGSEVFATRVESRAIDYRYDVSGTTSMTPYALPACVAEECVQLTHRLALELSGIDLCFADDGRVVCFEVNPSPAYIAYEEVTHQPISTALARHLTSR